MKNTKTSILVAIAFVIGIGVNNFAMSDSPANFKVAVVNVPAVVNASSEVQALKKEQQTKLEELQKWLNTAKTDISKQQTKEGKAKLVKKYDSDFVKKQNDIQKNYTTKLQQIDSNITKIINDEAKSSGYDLVLTKNVVLSGGTDITATISKKVK